LRGQRDTKEGEKKKGGRGKRIMLGERKGEWNGLGTVEIELKGMNTTYGSGGNGRTRELVHSGSGKKKKKKNLLRVRRKKDRRIVDLLGGGILIQKVGGGKEN